MRLYRGFPCHPVPARTHVCRQVRRQNVGSDGARRRPNQRCVDPDRGVLARRPGLRHRCGSPLPCEPWQPAQSPRIRSTTSSPPCSETPRCASVSTTSSDGASKPVAAPASPTTRRVAQSGCATPSARRSSSLRLTWDEGALADLAAAAEWSQPQARAVVEAMERMAGSGFSLGKLTDVPGGAPLAGPASGRLLLDRG
jgi:hypothetical protein